MKRNKVLAMLGVLALTVMVGVGCQQAVDASDDNNAGETTEVTTQVETEVGPYEDGTFEAESEADERGWKSTLVITVENGNIVEVDYNEVNEEGLSKADDEAYSERMEGASGVAPADAYAQLESSLLETQDIDAVDVVTGATSSSDKFAELVREALGLEVVAEAAFVDGTFEAELEADERGWKSTVVVTVENGNIVEVDYNEVNEEGLSKVDDEAYSGRMEEASGVAPVDAYAQLEGALLETQDIDAVDSVTGATSSSDKFKEVVAKALGL